MAFGNSILAGTKLVREAISSPNFVSNVSGWSVNKDGTAEFSNLIARGTIAAADPNDPENRYAYMADGIMGVVDENLPLISSLTESLLGFAADAGTMYFSFSDASGTHWRISGKHGVMISASDSRGFLRWNEDSINTNAEEWTDASLQNGWTNTAGFATVGYYMKPDGFVAFRGIVTAGTTADNTLIFTLPVNYRPAAAAFIGVPMFTGAAFVQSGMLIETDGECRVYGVGGAANIRLDGLCFSTL